MSEININTKKQSNKKTSSTHNFDPEMIYVECARCGRPLIWEKGTTTFIIQSSGVGRHLSPDWLILSRGCPTCSPDQDEFVLTLGRPGDNPVHSLHGKIKFN